tara:strand:- start:1129 stop:1341 length:213 start_codon:yes stop_codon:yes gene_type:complete
MTTVTLDIEEKHLINFYQLSEYNFKANNEDSNNKLFKAFPFILYKGRMGFTTINIPLENYILFLGSGLIK